MNETNEIQKDVNFAIGLIGLISVILLFAGVFILF